jgi:peptidoglycan/LPS O-acetylase OafA/YrhL
MSGQRIQPKIQRFAYLDVIRGIAALSVVITHIFELGIPGFRNLAGQVCNLGLFGVLLFFIVSGTVITASIERSPSLLVFWKQRFWRLIPAYWASLAVSAILFFLVPAELNYPVYGHIKDRFFATFAANTTMLQGFFGFDHFIPAYWTLGFEMLFYFALSILFVLKLGNRAHIVLWLISAILMVAAIVGYLKGTHVGSFKLILIGYFWLGIWVHRLLDSNITPKQFLSALLVFHVGVIATWFVNFNLYPAKVGEAYSEFPYSPVSMLTAFLGATLCFLWFLKISNATFPKALILLGNVSYSLYLFHSIAIRLGGMTFDQGKAPALFTVVTIILTCGLTALAYQFIEVPSLAKVKAVKLAASQQSPSKL